MLKALDVAKYFLDKDPERKYFNKNLVEYNGHTFYEGNAKLNKFLHLCQTVHIAKNNDLLMGDAFLAFDNGAVVEEVQQKFNQGLYMPGVYGISFDEETNDFLDRIYFMLDGSSVADLIELSHEDEEWIAKNPNRLKQKQQMDFMSCAEIYKKQYADGIVLMYEADLTDE